MKIVYATDLHGSEARYGRVLAVARKHGVAAVINGGDMLPLDGDLHGSQKDFIEGFLSGHFAGYEKAGIAWLGMPGNDDLLVHDAVFDEVCRKHRNIFSLARRRVGLNGFEFIGMNLVADYPFRLKDRCRRDGPGYVFQRQLGSALLSTREGFRELEDWLAYAAKLPTLEKELAALTEPAAPARRVYVIHMPPAGSGLDVISSGETVGSRAVAGFIRKRRPLLTLHGHIHESPEMSGVWKTEVGGTVCVQPGQARDAVTYVLADLADMRLERFVVPL